MDGPLLKYDSMGKELSFLWLKIITSRAAQKYESSILVLYHFFCLRNRGPIKVPYDAKFILYVPGATQTHLELMGNHSEPSVGPLFLKQITQFWKHSTFYSL